MIEWVTRDVAAKRLGTSVDEFTKFVQRNKVHIREMQYRDDMSTRKLYRAEDVEAGVKQVKSETAVRALTHKRRQSAAMTKAWAAKKGECPGNSELFKQDYRQVAPETRRLLTAKWG